MAKKALTESNNDEQLAALLEQVESGLESVDLSEYVAQNEAQVERIAHVITNSSSLKAASFKKMALPTAGIRHIAKAIEASASLARVDLGWNGIDSAGILRLART